MTDPFSEDESDDLERPFASVRPPRHPSQVYSVRIPVGRLEDLRRAAEAVGEGPSTYMRRVVLESLRGPSPLRMTASCSNGRMIETVEESLRWQQAIRDKS